MAERGHQSVAEEEAAPSSMGQRQRWSERLRWLRSPWFGYLGSFLIVGALLLVEKIDETLPQASIFIGTPFALAPILVALIWGIGPALLALILGFIALAYFIPSDIFSPNLLKDIRLDGPFVLAQLIAVAAVVQLERFHRKLEAAYRELTRAYRDLASAHRELENAQRQILQNNRQLERANALKDYIITRSSHELRTPLTTILGRTQLLRTRLQKSGETPETWQALQQYLEVMEVRALHLRELIESLFDLSRVQARELPLREAPLDLVALCRKVVAEQSSLADRPIDLELPPTELLLEANEELLCQVLLNLVNNALKYSPEASPIKIRVFSEGSQIVLQIHNEALPLSPEQLERLFEPFYRTSEVEYSTVPGWGLGLTISKEIVEQYGGQIRAESSPGQGVTLIVTFPPALRLSGTGHS